MARHPAHATIDREEINDAYVSASNHAQHTIAILRADSPDEMSFSTALPTPQEVLGFPGREANWGARIGLRSLAIADGVATVDFSRELRAYGGGSARVRAIREQITRTLTQFSSVREVRIAIEGQTEGVLEP